MAGQNRILNAELNKPKAPKGTALKSAIASTFSPKRISGVTGKEVQGKGKK